MVRAGPRVIPPTDLGVHGSAIYADSAARQRHGAWLRAMARNDGLAASRQPLRFRPLVDCRQGEVGRSDCTQLLANADLGLTGL